ncbi:aldo/keto reductase [Parendozoicomonas haliclonae]|uniref:General stress protein 69 n=1 Tax=Parendozoicomonas haliclonae TaxID=1960125 RepID=A0A1X7AFG2_9GAMM|nr:aldo/keto reductase [Parendozoicomonas haliclonae]SMA37724.1 General stress protein 69 [Parendozoicomonas haliclonae]
MDNWLRPVADTGLMISPVGFGTVKLGRNEQVKYPTAFEIPDDKKALELLALARDLGINLLDTAPAYGTSEERLGGLIKGQRDQWIICTKVGEEFENGESRFDFTPEHIRKSIERSLQRLKTDYLDMVLVHSDGNDVEIIERYGCLDVLNDLKREGLIRATGMSTKTVEGGIKVLEQADCAMVTWNLNEQGEREVLDYAARHGKSILVKKALASGHLAAGEDPVQKSMDFVFAHPGVTSAVLGTINPKHMEQNVQAVRQVILSHT